MNFHRAGSEKCQDDGKTNDLSGIAIVGIGCRFPGGISDPESYWNFIVEKRCGIKVIPKDRWNPDIFYNPDQDAIASSVSKWAGFMDDIKSFDPSYFGISPREASSMDPQQRLLLQCVQEAMADSRIPERNFQARKTGVFVGISQSDYRLIQEMRLTNAEIFAGTGYALCINANRISHRFGLHGPSYAVDTACSSSMVALDQACLNIKSGACEMAVVCGVNVLAHPIPFVAFSRAGMLSDTGVVSTFDSEANGYVRGEGVGVVIVKPLEKALADGDNIYAVIEATSVNQDGYTNTLTAPNQMAQMDMLSTLCENAGVSPDKIGFVEAHGTGTPIGDPIEAGAIGEVLGKARSDGPLYVGSVKPNIGHLESAAGIAGLIKATLAIKNGKIPPNINFHTANPNISMAALNIQVPTSVADFPEADGHRYAVVNSFGFGGTNASALLSQAPVAPVQLSVKGKPSALLVAENAGPVILPLAAANQESLKGLARELINKARDASTNGTSLRSLAAGLSAGLLERSYRAAVVANDVDGLISGLQKIALGEPANNKPEAGAPFVVTGEANADRKICFVFTGQGSQWWAMGRQLLLHNDVFRETVEAFDSHFKGASGWSIKDELLKSEADTRIDDTVVTQPALFAIQTGLSALWRSYGVAPHCLLGHSIGESSAMYVAGGLTLKSAAGFLDRRGTIRQHIHAKGAMAAVSIDVEDVKALLRNEEKLELAAINAPGSVTITGDETAIEDFIQRFEAEHTGKFIRRLRVDTAWHSYQLDEAEAWFRETMKPLEWSAPEVPFISTVTGKIETVFDKDYGWLNLRCPVMFQQGIECAVDLGANLFIEIGPHSTLAGPITGTCSALGANVQVINSLDRTVDDRFAILSALARLYVVGGKIDWTGVQGIDTSGLTSPRYPWAEKVYWVESEEAKRLLQGTRRHPLLGLPVAGAKNQWQGEVSLVSQRYLADHRLQSDCIYPATGYIEMLLAAGRQIFGDVPLEITDTKILEALFIGKNDDIIFHTSISEDRNICRVFSHVRDADASEWILRAEGQVRPCQTIEPGPVKFDAGAKGYKEIELKHLYDVSEADAFINYGPAFRTVTRLWMNSRTTTARIEKPIQVEREFNKYFIHPTMLDACLQITDPRVTLKRIMKDRVAGDPTFLPIGAQTIRFFRPWPEQILVHAVQLHSAREDTAQGGFVVTDLDGNTVLTMHGLIFRSLRGKETSVESSEIRPECVIENLVELAAVPPPVEGQEAAAGKWLLFCDDDRVVKALTQALSGPGSKIECFRRSDTSGELSHWFADTFIAEAQTQSIAGIVYGWGLESSDMSAAAPTSKLLSVLEPKVIDLVALGKALDEVRENEKHPAVWVLTGKARLAGNEEANPAMLVNAPLVALTRTLASEFQESRIRQIDLDTTAINVATLRNILLGSSADGEFILRDGCVFVPRLQRTRFEDLPGKALVIDRDDKETNFQVTMDSAGIIDHLRIQEIDHAEPSPTEVQVRVDAVGLNFRDIMAATGLLPREAESEPAWRTLGLEFGAVVAKVGRKVKNFKPGDKVMGMAKSCLQRYLTLPSQMLVKIPGHIKLADAATIPSAYATAYYALHTIGRLRKGERVLIHVATGGVGLAAIQIAQYIGAEIFATAGSPEKRAYLRKLGIRHVMNSRSLDFADEVTKITKGAGVDVLLNSLPDSYIKKGLDIMAPYGRFLEIGKRDVYADSSFGLKALRRNVSINVLDLAAMGVERPQLMGEIFAELVNLFRAKKLKPLPHTDFPVSKVAAAFKFMSQAKHIGKVVVLLDEKQYRVVENRGKPFTLSRNASYLVTGGSRGFGIAVAEWLGGCGAGQVLLSSRSGTVDSKYRARIAKLERRGTKITAIGLDITDQQAVEAVIRKHAGRTFPLKGVIHGAAVIEDGLLSQLGVDQVRRVIGPKVAGAWNIHLAMRKLKLQLDFVVNFSSVAQVLGSVGQGNYVAANAFLDAIADYWSANGVNGRTVDWGVLGQSGFVTRNDSLANYLESVGMHGVSDKDACNALEGIIRTSRASMLFASLDWEKIARANPVLGSSPRIAPMLQKKKGNASEIRQELMALPLEQRSLRLQEFLCGEVGKVLKVDAKQVPVDRPMTELGLDSLSSFELKNRIEGEMDMTIAISKFLKATDITQLSVVVSHEMQKLADQQATSGNETDADKTGKSGDKTKPADEYLPTDRQVKLYESSLARMTTRYGRSAFINCLAVVASPAIGEAAARQAWAMIARNHPLLRARVASDKGSNGEALSFGGKLPDIHFMAEPDLKAATDLAFESGELLKVTIARLPGDKSALTIAVHVAVADAFGVQQLLQEFLAAVAGSGGVTKPRKKELLKLLERGRFDFEKPSSMTDRAFWYHAVNPMPAKLGFTRRKRALVPAHLGCNGGPVRKIDFRFAASVDGKSLLKFAQAATSALRAESGTGQPVMFALATSNRVNRGSVNATIGLLESQHPIVAPTMRDRNDKFMSAHMMRILHGMEDHTGLDLHKFSEIFKPQIDSANAAPFQFGLRWRNASEVHPLERQLASGSCDVSGYRLEAIELEPPAMMHDMFFDLTEENGLVNCVLHYDTEAVDSKTAADIAEALRSQMEEAQNQPQVDRALV